MSQKEIYEHFYQLSSRIFFALNEVEKNGFNLLYCPRGSSVRQFGRLYRENKAQMNRCYVKENSQLVEFELSSPMILDAAQETEISADDIYQAIIEKDKKEKKRYLEILLVAAEQEDYITYLWCLKEIMIALKRMEEEMEAAKNAVDFSLAEGVNQYDLRIPQSVVEFLRYKFREIEKSLLNKQGTAYSQSIQEAVDYIWENYAQEDMSNILVARQVNLSGSWLSTKFKEEVGMGVSDYLNSVRIQQAKKLFDEKNYMIYEVAGKVGFASSQYFSRIFKQVTGMTPNEYRKLKDGESFAD